MKRKKWFCLLLAVVLLLTGCGGRENGSDNTGGSENSAQGGNASGSPAVNGIESEGIYDIELTKEAIAPPCRRERFFLGHSILTGRGFGLLGIMTGRFSAITKSKMGGHCCWKM